MTDFNDFMALEENQPMAKQYKPRVPKKQVYVCKLCGRVQLPTSERNIRCSGCNSPILSSLEKISTIQKDIKRYYLYSDTVKKLKALKQQTKKLRSEYYQILESKAITQQLEDEPLPQKRITRQRDKFLIFHLVIFKGRVDQYPNGFTGNVKVPVETKDAFVKKCEKLRIQCHLVGTEKEIAVMEDIRQFMLEYQGEK